MVSLTSSDPAVVVPPGVTVAAGQSVSPTFNLATTLVAAPVTVTITATYDGISKTDTLVVNPLVVSALTLSPTSVNGGVAATGNRVALNAAAPAGGAVVSLSSDNPAVAAVPASVTVAAGQTLSPTFSITTTAVASPVTVTITATYNGSVKQSVLTVTP